MCFIESLKLAKMLIAPFTSTDEMIEKIDISITDAIKELKRVNGKGGFTWITGENAIECLENAREEVFSSIYEVLTGNDIPSSTASAIINTYIDEAFANHGHSKDTVTYLLKVCHA